MYIFVFAFRFLCGYDAICQYFVLSFCSFLLFQMLYIFLSFFHILCIISIFGCFWFLSLLLQISVVLQFTFGSLFQVFLLTVLCLFVFYSSILGMNLFGCKFCRILSSGRRKCDRKNFDSLLWAIVTVFQVLLAPWALLTPINPFCKSPPPTPLPLPCMLINIVPHPHPHPHYMDETLCHFW